MVVVKIEFLSLFDQKYFLIFLVSGDGVVLYDEEEVYGFGMIGIMLMEGVGVLLGFGDGD